jgi:hypothetical protein
MDTQPDPTLMQVNWKGETYQCRPAGGMGDMIAFEAQFGVPASVLDPEDDTPMELSWAAFMAYRGMRKSNLIPRDLTFEDFVDDLEWMAAPGAQVDEEGNEVVPPPFEGTAPAPSPSSLPLSP